VVFIELRGVNVAGKSAQDYNLFILDLSRGHTNTKPPEGGVVRFCRRFPDILLSVSRLLQKRGTHSH